MGDKIEPRTLGAGREDDIRDMLCGENSLLKSGLTLANVLVKNTIEGSRSRLTYH
jgi:hypothetical protein